MAVPTSTAKEDAALSLTVAVVAASHGPLLLLDRSLNVIVASRSFCRAFNIDPTAVVGRSINALGQGEWNVPQLRALLKAAAADDLPIEEYEFDLHRAGATSRRLCVNAERLSYLDLDHVRLLVAVADVTDARADERAREQAIRENERLLQEASHRIANSLQIIASVLLHGARKTQSEETRGHLRNAHSRVMSVASLERQLSASTGDEVRIRTYLTKLCASIGEAMINEADRIAIEVASDDTSVPASVSVSLGLITTELVINALKHAFPDGRAGKITVTYTARGGSWSLRVSDDGIGMPPGPAGVGAGLGTSIVQALARQLDASVQIVDAHPGVSVSISHEAMADVTQ